MKRYPAEKETIQRALAETIEQVNAGIPVPTEKRVVIEDWEEFVIIHSNFGSLANRALAQLLGQVLSEKLGHGIVVQHDPYRIFVQTVGAANADRILEVFDELRSMPEQHSKRHADEVNCEDGSFQETSDSCSSPFWSVEKMGRFQQR